MGRYCRAARMLPSLLSAHRLVLVAIRIAVKAHHDIFRSNKTYASAGGLRLNEFNQLEFMMICRIEFKVLVKNEELEYTRNAIANAAECMNRAADPTCLSSREWLEVATHVADAMQPRVTVVPQLSEKDAAATVRYEASSQSNTSTPSTSSTQMPVPKFLRGSPSGAASRNERASRPRSPPDSEGHGDSRFDASDDVPSPRARPPASPGGSDPMAPKPPPTVSGSGLQAVAILRKSSSRV